MMTAAMPRETGSVTSTKLVLAKENIIIADLQREKC
jgi:hypothetical protein